MSAGRGAHVELAPARVGIGGVRALRGGITRLDRSVGRRRRGAGEWSRVGVASVGAGVGAWRAWAFVR